MKTHFLLFLTAFCIISSATAQDSTPCIEGIAEIDESTIVEVVKRDSMVVEGEFLSFDQHHILLSTHPLGQRETKVESYQINDIMKIKYEKSGSVNPWYMLLGLAGGAIIGLPAAAVAASGRSGFSGVDVGVGVWLGCTGAGLIVGTVLPLLHHSDRIIECK